MQGAPINVGDFPISVAFTPDGKTAYVVNQGDVSVSAINVKTGTVQGAPINVGDFPTSVAFSPNGKTAYVTNAGDATVSVITTR
ncbi:unannotated protein [freshwater metagenome]|uniref:Unannotated protein n=1 Tax=freshwater metagenome TaxID=449393 RepID=A0A6J6F2L2_9ZZZZ